MRKSKSIKLILTAIAIVVSFALSLFAYTALATPSEPAVQEFEAGYFGISSVGSKKLTIVARGAELSTNGQNAQNKVVDQVFRYRVTGKSENEFINFEVLIVGNGSITVTNMPSGHYVVTEIQDGTWRYETEAISRQVNLYTSLAGAAVFNHNKTTNKWLNEFSSPVVV